MADTVKGIPDDKRAAVPYLAVRGAARALEFYETAFGAVEKLRFNMADGRVGHAEFSVGDAAVMLSDEFPDQNINGPETLGGTSCSVHLYVEDVDAFVEKAVGGGAEIVQKVEDQFYGDRTGKIKDPFGHVWWIATHMEDLSPEEIGARAKALFG